MLDFRHSGSIDYVVPYAIEISKVMYRQSTAYNSYHIDSAAFRFADQRFDR